MQNSIKSNIWLLDGARPFNTCIQPYLRGNVTDPVAVHPTHPQKYICKYKKLAQFGEIPFNSLEKEFYKLTFGNSEFVKWKNRQSKKNDKPSSSI